MAKNLVIVESPSKSKTIKKMLGSSYTIKSSYGHIIDLPKTTLGIDLNDNYKPRYKVIKDKKKVLEELQKEAIKSDNIFLASDPDREGESIAWHIANYLKMPKKIKRIEFNEITKTAVQNAIKNPRDIDINLVDAQQTRRILDRIVGYKISPLLWGQINKNASAGRVQSVSLKLICDLEDEIKNFISEKYFDISLLTEDEMKLNLYKIDNNKIDKLKDESLKDRLLEVLKDNIVEIKDVSVKKKIQQPPLPFKTSTLQQLASTYLDFSPSKTMSVAQQLYEGIDINGETKGLITYMRTDSTRISKEASEQAQQYILDNFGKEYCGKNRIVKSNKNIQDAHEGIRPTYIDIVPDMVMQNGTRDQYKLYKLIWERFLISQFAPVEYEQFKVIANKEEFEFSGILNKVLKEGYYKIYKSDENFKTSDFPDYQKGNILKIRELSIKESMTKPPARYTEATLVNKLESLGIGRPSTYASILDTLKKKVYVELIDKKLHPTTLGVEVKIELEENFKKIMNVKFTKELEEHLDQIALGKASMVEILDLFYKSLEKEIDKYQKKIDTIKNKKIFTDVLCKNGVDIMLYKTGIYGKYLVCETDETEKITLKDIEIDKKELEEGLLHIKDKLNPVDILKDKYTDFKTKDGKTYLLKTGRFGYYLESEDYINDKKRITLEKKYQTKIKNNKIPVKDGILQISVFLESEVNEVERLIEEAGKCEKCGSNFTVKKGRYGKFLACSNYPTCKNIRNIKKKK